MENVDWISGEQFKEVADFIYAPKIKLTDDYDNLVNTIDWGKLKDCNIIYTHTIYVKTLFDIIQHIDKKFVIITHNCDCRVEENGIVTPNGRSEVGSIDFYTLPDNVIKWYASNLNTIHPRIESLPIGLENKMWMKVTPKKDLMIKKLKQPKQDKNLLYINHQLNTNIKQRLEPYQLFEKEPWVTTEKGHNGKDFNTYINNIYNHKFMICPEGNGIGTHRTWECLYMGTIPIEKRGINNSFYEDLPICFVNEWKEVTKAFLEKEYKRIKKRSWNMGKLYFSYWKTKIQDSAKTIIDGEIGKIPINELIEKNLNMRIQKGKVLVQIGTNYGADEFNAIAKYAEASKIVLVEPDSKLNDKIFINYAGVNNVFIENVAITEVQKGLVKLVTPKDAVRDYSLLPMDDWGDDFITLEVSSMTFNELCSKYGINNVHYLQIDTEGYDAEIIKAIDFKKINIDIIKYENWNFTEDCFKRYGEKSKLYGLNGMKDVAILLTYLGYELTDYGMDTLAVKPE